MSEQETIITIKNLTKVFKVNQKSKEGLRESAKQLFHRDYIKVTAVNNISMAVKKGEIRALIGPNGAGKSTTIKMMAGVLYPTDGLIDVMGYVPWIDRKKYVKNIGVVMGQKSQLLWDLPPIDTFALNKEIYSVPKNKYENAIEYFKELLGIADIIKRPVRQLSLGERMKCELVCAMLHEPPLVYLDEPTIGLDMVAKEAIRSFIKKINADKKTTFILTTHNMDDVENLCKNITVINKGIIVYDESIDHLKTMISNKKIIHVKFSQNVARESLKDYEVIEYQPMEAKIDVNLNKFDIQDVVSSIFKTFPCSDININGIGIEEVVKQVYQW